MCVCENIAPRPSLIQWTTHPAFKHHLSKILSAGTVEDLECRNHTKTIQKCHPHLQVVHSSVIMTRRSHHWLCCHDDLRRAPIPVAIVGLAKPQRGIIPPNRQLNLGLCRWHVACDHETYLKSSVFDDRSVTIVMQLPTQTPSVS